MATRKGMVYRCNQEAGIIEELDDAYRFTYLDSYILSDAPPISLTLPKQQEPYVCEHLFPFFISLLAEGNLAVEQCRRLQIDEDDYFGRLIITAGGDVIGTVTVRELS